MSSINANATVTLTVNGKQAQDMLDGLKKKSQDLEKAIEKAAQSGNKASLQKLQKELKQTNRQIAQIESATVGVERVMKNLDKATPKELNKTLSQLKKQLNGIERGTEEWNRQCEAIKRVKKEIDRVNADLRETEGRWSKFNRIVNDWQTTIMGAAAAVTGLVMAGRSAVSAYADMEQEMANVRKFTGMTADEVKQLNEELKKIDTRTSREDLNKLAQEAGRLGKTSLEDVLGFVKAADQINVALDDLGEGATLTLSKLTNIFGDEKRLGTEKALLSVGSVINELSQNCTASAPYLAQFAQRLAGVGAQAKMTIPEIMGFAAVLDSQGQAVEMSATALSKLISDLFKNTDLIIKSTGLNAKEFKDVLAKDVNAALIMLFERLHELGNIDVLAPVFADMKEDGARASAVLAALAGNIDKVKWEQEEANKAFQEGTSITKEFDVQNNTVKAGLEKASKRVKEVAVELGEKLMPVMKHVISSTTLLLKAMTTTINFFIKYKAEIIAATATLAVYAIAVNLATVKVKLAAAATAAWNVVLKAKAVLLPIVNVLLNGMKLAYERVVWQTRGATATQQAFNKSLIALRNNALAAKAALALGAVAVAALAVAMVKWIKSNNEAVLAQKRLKEINEKANAATSETITKINLLRTFIEDNTRSVDDRRRAINELQQIVPSYHASIDTEGKLYGHNTKVLDLYIEKLKAAARVQAALDKLPEVEKERDSWFNDAPKNFQDAYFNEKMNGMEEQEAAARANASLSGYRSWKTGLSKKESAVNQVNSIIESEAKRSEGLNAQMDALGNPGKGNPGDYVPTSSGSNSDKKHEDKFKAEKEWKAKEEALNRIAYATGIANYEQYTNRMVEIEQEYQKKITNRQDLTEQERLDSLAGYHEATKKLSDQMAAQSVERENQYYNELMAMEKQRYIDGAVDKETYEKTIELLEIQHLKRMVSLYKEGTKERLNAEKAYQDKLIADQEKHRKETEQKEKEHQKKLQDLKKEYFGDNAAERRKKYMSDMEALKELYNSEIKAAADNAKEKLRIEKAFEEAKKQLREKYNIDADEDGKNWLEKTVEDIDDWIKDPKKGGKWIKALETVTNAMSGIFQQYTSLIQAETEIQTAAINKRYDQEISRAEGNTYQVKQLEKKKEAEIAKVKNAANKRMFKMQVIEAVAQTATAAVNAYSSAAAIKGIGYIIAPIAAAAAIAAGMIQVAAIKKQQKAAEAQGYAKGGFTGDGKRDEVAGVVHKGEWVASQDLVNSPVARPMIDALDYAQRTNTIGSLGTPVVIQSAPAQTVVMQASSPISGVDPRMVTVLAMLAERLNEPFVTVNTVEGDRGIKQAQDEYDKLIRNKTPKSRRK